MSTCPVLEVNMDTLTGPLGRTTWANLGSPRSPMGLVPGPVPVRGHTGPLVPSSSSSLGFCCINSLFLVLLVDTDAGGHVSISMLALALAPVQLLCCLVDFWG